MKRAMLLIGLALTLTLAGCGGGGSSSTSVSARTGTATETGTGTGTRASSTATVAKRARAPKHAFELADCLRAEHAATRLATDAIRSDRSTQADGATALMRTDLMRLVTDMRSIFPSTYGQAGQLRRTRHALAGLEGDGADAVVRGLGEAPVKNIASLLRRTCS